MELIAATEAAATEPRQVTLPLTLREEPSAYAAAPLARPAETAAEKVERTVGDVKPSPEVELLNTVREILRRELVEARTEEEVAILLAVTKPQAKTWLVRLVGESVLEKVTNPKPARYRTANKVERLL
jgi:hypothetical protein